MRTYLDSTNCVRVYLLALTTSSSSTWGNIRSAKYEIPIAIIRTYMSTTPCTPIEHVQSMFTMHGNSGLLPIEEIIRRIFCSHQKLWVWQCSYSVESPHKLTTAGKEAGHRCKARQLDAVNRSCLFIILRSRSSLSFFFFFNPFSTASSFPPPELSIPHETTREEETARLLPHDHGPRYRRRDGAAPRPRRIC